MVVDVVATHGGILRPNLLSTSRRHIPRSPRAENRSIRATSPALRDRRIDRDRVPAPHPSAEMKFRFSPYCADARGASKGLSTMGLAGIRHYAKVKFRIFKGKLVNEEAVEHQYRRALRHLSRNGEELVGDYLEFGVYNGTSMACMHRVLDELDIGHVRLIGFDSFEGLPDNAAEDDDGNWSPGDFEADYETTKRRLADLFPEDDRIVLVKGWFSDTLNDATREAHRIDKASVIMVDCDLYSSAKAALDFVAPVIRDEAVIVFDDWNANDLAQRGMGEKRAFDEFLAENPQFTVEHFGGYSFVDDDAHGQVFLVSRS
jgi:predicted O-methyltransferase YrrM